jgi:hypothetical protein
LNSPELPSPSDSLADEIQQIIKMKKETTSEDE